MSDEHGGPAEVPSLLERCSLAAMRDELGLLTPSQRSRAKELLDASPEHFDGAQLVELCLEGRASDDARVLQRALLTLRSRFVESPDAAPRRQRRRGNLIVRGSASLTAKLIFSAIYTIVLVALLYVLNYHFKWLNIYELGNQVMSLLGLEIRAG